jgi:hypothetical protein
MTVVEMEKKAGHNPIILVYVAEGASLALV